MPLLCCWCCCWCCLQGKDETGKAILDYWKPSLTLLADKDLIARLKSYDKDNIPPKWVASFAC
jgi:hypothetical protein